MTILQNLPRWIKASLAKYFDTVLSPNIQFYVEGDKRPVFEASDVAELRVDGPFITPRPSNYYDVTVEINILIKSICDHKDLYKMERKQGFVIDSFTNFIEVKKYGDDGSHVGCLQLETDERKKLIVSNFGLIDVPNKIMQASIEGHYCMSLKG